MNTLVVFDSGRWVRLDGNAVSTRGDALADALPVGEDESVVAVLPARDVTVRTLPLPDLSDAQAQTAARLAMAEHSLTPGEALHVAAGPADQDGNRTAVAVEAVKVTERLLALADYGLDPDRLLAAPLLVPQPTEGLISARFDDETILRGTDIAFVDDPAITPLLTGGAAVETLDRSALETALARGVYGTNADLRHGAFAKRRRLAVDAQQLRRIAILFLVVGLVVLATAIIEIVRVNFTASNIESDNRQQAAALLPPGTVITDPALQAEARLASIAGAGGGFTPLASSFATAINASPNVELGAMIFDGTGGLRATVRAASEADLVAVETRLAAAGLKVVPGPVVGNQGRPYRDITVTVR